MWRKLTQKQQRVYAYIRDNIEKKSVSPTVSEIAQFLGVSSLRTVTQYLEALEKKQLIRRARHRSRGIRLLDGENAAMSATVSLPVVSWAGCDNLSVLAEPICDEFITIDRGFLRNRNPRNMVVVKAVGDSMMDGGIDDGDMVLTERATEVCDKDKVVAIVDGMAVIKLIRFSTNAVILSPMSSDRKYRPIIMRSDFQVFGKVIEVIKGLSDGEELSYEKV